MASQKPTNINSGPKGSSRQDAPLKGSYVGGGSYDGNTIPDSLLNDDSEAKDAYKSQMSIIRTLKQVLGEEYLLEGTLDDIFGKALRQKHGKEYAALNQALPLMKKTFNIWLCDIVVAVSEIVLDDNDYKMKWVDVSNTKTIKAELEERHFPNKNDVC